MMTIGFKSSEWKSMLKEGIKSLDLNLRTRNIDDFAEYASELIQANRSVNLTRVTSPEEVAEVLILDSLVPGKYIAHNAKVMDLGSGAGLPGIPLKIGYPDLRLILADSKRKKVNFLNYIIRHLNLENIQALHTRAEEMVGSRFDVVISRAVSSLKNLAQLALPLLNSGGVLIAMKGRGYQDEIYEFEKDFAVQFPEKLIRVDCKDYCLPRSGINRTLLLVSSA